MRIEICSVYVEITTMSFTPEMNDFSHAIVRLPGETLSGGLTTAAMGSPDYALALKQHREYVLTLKKLELNVLELPALPEFPDAHFVEDVAVLTPELAVITRPGAQSRRGEIDFMIPVLSDRFDTVAIEPPSILDGGDVLIIGKDVFVGLSERTNGAGIDQLERFLREFGYTTFRIPLERGLHLKSNVNYIGENLLLMVEEYVDVQAFHKFEKVVVTPEESYACNTLWINDNLILPGGFPETREMLEDMGLPMHILDMSEMQKMDGGLTCLSLRY